LIVIHSRRASSINDWQWVVVYALSTIIGGRRVLNGGAHLSAVGRDDSDTASRNIYLVDDVTPFVAVL